MNYMPLAFTLGFFEILVLTFMLVLTANQNNKDNRLTNTNYFVSIAVGFIIMVVLALGTGKAVAMSEPTTVEQINKPN